MLDELSCRPDHGGGSRVHGRICGIGEKADRIGWLGKDVGKVSVVRDDGRFVD